MNQERNEDGQNIVRKACIAQSMSSCLMIGFNYRTILQTLAKTEIKGNRFVTIVSYIDSKRS